MSTPRILVAGIGNIFLGDDAFGVEVVQRLINRSWPDSVTVKDFGIRSFDLAYAMLDDYDVTIFVDAMPRGDVAGTLYVLEADLNANEGAGEIEAHSMDPVKVLNMVRVLGGQPRRVLVVGCEPATFGPENEGQMGLSEPVQSAVDEAVRMVEELVDKLMNNQTIGATS
jgi:hydrogenase maturation protease